MSWQLTRLSVPAPRITGCVALVLVCAVIVLPFSSLLGCLRPVPSDATTHVLAHFPLHLDAPYRDESDSWVSEAPCVESRIDHDALGDVFLASLGWRLVGFVVRAEISSTMSGCEIVLREVRRGERELMRVSLPHLVPPYGVLFGTRIAAGSESPAEVTGEVVVAMVVDRSLSVLARRSLPYWALPSMEAVGKGWLDAAGTRSYIRRLSPDVRSSLMYSMSWNGVGSTTIAQIHELQERGSAFDISFDSPPDEATRIRTRGAVVDWPEPFWQLSLELPNR